ncbi:SseB family protein [Streptomyces sp.]|uniref:SseB family protein n=1 Tax=Streptomyces sp. TaxID=1931 RepID=UPI002C74F22D|nr:SseB family protein [Streptomyces sp.]HLL35940.1 SseB family protein [Streptomyces sp.]HZF91982.1 SseB family protein [Streptomyces sp.]
MSTGVEAGDLVDVVRRAREGLAPPQDVFDTFVRARVYCERPEKPGFLTVPAPTAVADENIEGPRSSLLDLVRGGPTPGDAARLVPVFSSLDEFALFAGEGPWFSTTGADVLDLLPPGLDVWLDPASEHAVRLASAAVGDTRPVLHISYRNGGGAADER